MLLYLFLLKKWLYFCCRSMMLKHQTLGQKPPGGWVCFSSCLFLRLWVLWTNQVIIRVVFFACHSKTVAESAAKCRCNLKINELYLDWQRWFVSLCLLVMPVFIFLLQLAFCLRNILPRFIFRESSQSK